MRIFRSKETVRVEEHKVELEEGGVRLKLTVVKILMTISIMNITMIMMKAIVTTNTTQSIIACLIWPNKVILNLWSLNSLEGYTFAVEGHIFVVYSTRNPEVIWSNRTQSKTEV